MAASLQDIKEWLGMAQELGAHHMIVACDTFDHEDYPVFIAGDKSVTEKVNELRTAEFTRVMEVYNLSKPIEPQLREQVAWNI